MIGELLRFANRVIAWLGPEENNSSRAMEIVSFVGSQIIVDWITKVILPSPGCSQHILAQKAAELDFLSENAGAIYRLISRPWYERLWIRQDI